MSESPPPKTGRRENLLALTVATVITLALADMALQALGYGQKPANAERDLFWRFDPELGWKHEPGQSGVFESASFSTAVEINSRGLRDSEHPYARIPGKRRILMLGDSLVWGFGVEGHECLTERLEALMPNTEVINAGVSGYSTDQEYLWLKSEGLGYRPDLVVLLLTGNDDFGNHRSIIYQVYGKPRFRLGERPGELLGPEPPPAVPLATRFLHWLLKNSAIAHQIHLVIRGQEVSEDFELTLRLLDRISELAHSIDADFLVASTSAFWLPSGSGYADLVQAIHDRGLPVLDLDRVIGRAPSYEDGHWNAQGHELAAKAIAAFIRSSRPDT